MLTVLKTWYVIINDFEQQMFAVDHFLLQKIETGSIYVMYCVEQCNANSAFDSLAAFYANEHTHIHYYPDNNVYQYVHLHKLQPSTQELSFKTKKQAHMATCCCI